MLIIATFNHSAYLELALVLLEQKGFSKGSILAAPLEKQPREDKSEFNVVHKSGESAYDLAFIFAMIFMLLGAIYGFLLEWGPIIWSIIGIVLGAVLGLILEVLMGKIPFKTSNDPGSEVVLIISCELQETTTVETILWNHQAIGVSKVMT